MDKERNYSFTIEMIEGISNLEEMELFEIKLMDAIRNAKGQVTDAKAKFFKDKSSVDPDWYSSIHKYKGVLEGIRQRAALKKKQIKKQVKQDEHILKANFWRGKCKEIMTNEMFLRSSLYIEEVINEYK